MARRADRGVEYFATPLPRLIAHRGLTVDAAENTLDAFSAALDAGATHLELDVHATRDGEVIVVHDPSLARVLGRSDRMPAVSDLTLSEIRDLAGPSLSVCTLVELLRKFPAARLNIDVKAADAAVATGRIVAAEQAQARVLLTSFSAQRRRTALREQTGAATSASAGATLVATVAARMGLQFIVDTALRRVDAVQIPERIVGIRTTTADMIDRFHRAGVEVHVWTINDPSDMDRVLDVGADGVVTDRVDLLAGLVADRRGSDAS